MTEHWKAVEGWPYEISDCGRIRRSTDSKRGLFPAGYVLSPHVDTRGYYRVLLTRFGGPTKERKLFRVHVLVAEAFLGPRPAGLVVNHKDGDYLHNASSNLEWVTQKQNIWHAVASGLFNRKLCPSQAIEIYDRCRAGESRTVVARDYRVTVSMVGCIARRVVWRGTLDEFRPQAERK